MSSARLARCPPCVGGNGRVSVLLLGDSRDRLVYGQTVGPLCTGAAGGCRGTSRLNGSGAPHCYSWQWASPSEFPIHSYWQSAAGALCQNGPNANSRLAAFGYMIHFGLSPTAPFLSDWSTHSHVNWSGLGWMDAIGDQPAVNSAALAVEAAGRFTSRAPSDSRVCVVFSSLLWDLGRRVEHFPRQSLHAWADEYRRNYTRLVLELQDVLARHDASQSHRSTSLLALATAYDVPRHWKFYEPKLNATARMLDLVAEHVRATASRQRLPLVDLQRRFREVQREQPGVDLIDMYGHPRAGLGTALAWNESSQACGVCSSCTLAARSARAASRAVSVAGHRPSDVR